MRIRLNVSTFGEEEIEQAVEAMRSGFVTMGPRCEKFESAFAAYLGGGEAAFVNSGSSANLLAFFALANDAAPKRPGKRKFFAGAEVIVPAVTWSTTIWPIIQSGLIPVLVDSDPRTLQMDVEAMKAAITRKTVAVCPVHVLGNTVAMDELLAAAAEHELWVIEDTCEALGSRYRGTIAGTMGDIGTFSFFFSHHITTIEGGMVTTRDPEIAELMRCLRAHGWTRQLKRRGEIEARHPEIDPAFLFVNTGFNVRPTEINAAFGLVQLGRLDGFNQRRKAIAADWIGRLGALIEDGTISPMQPTPGADCAWFGFPMLCRNREVRDALKRRLDERGVEHRPIICGNMARQPALARLPHRIAGTLSGADAIMDRGLLWGAHPLMTDAEVDYVARTALSVGTTV
ncbi:MAG: DegT/DnrJ/EryC1/StrS family aminotransferase [Acidobacteriia bacterium]|nr:DegT/DnrJ/EryC1/StrS family aminotransferase [Terriglobia bacterium]